MQNSLDEDAVQLPALQAAVTDNGKSVKVVAEQLENTVQAVDRGAELVQIQLRDLNARLQRAQRTAIAATVIALFAIGFAALRTF